MTFSISLSSVPHTVELLERVSGIPGWGEKSARNLVDSVAQVAMEGVSLERFIYSLGIRHLGLYSSRIIANHFGSARSFLDELEVASRGIASAFEGLHNDGSENRISGIGPVLVASLIDFAKESSLVEAAADLACAVRVVNDQEKAASSTAQSKKPFSGLKVVFTGSLPNFRRTDAKKIAVIMGATSTPDIVTESTNLVVEGNNGGKKLLKARMLGIRVMTAEEFLRLADAFR